MQRIGFIGIGLMGQHMAKRVHLGGYPLTIWNRTKDKARPLLEAGAAWADSPRAVAQVSDLVITMVTDSAASDQVVCGPGGVLEGAHSGLILVDMSSITPETSRAIAERAAASSADKHGFFNAFSVQFREIRPIRVQNHGNS